AIRDQDVRFEKDRSLRSTDCFEHRGEVGAAVVQDLQTIAVQVRKRQPSLSSAEKVPKRHDGGSSFDLYPARRQLPRVAGASTVLFVTGTRSGVGKTTIAAALVRRFRV